VEEDTTAFDGDRDHGFVQNVAGLYTSPGKEFVSILRGRRLWAPLAGLMVLSIAFTILWLRNVDATEFMKARNEESPRMAKMPADQRQQVLDTQVRMFPAIGWVIALVSNPVLVFGLGALFLFVYRFFYSANMTYTQSSAVVAWSFFAVSLVVTPLMLLTLGLKGDWTIPPGNALEANPAMFLDKAATAKPLYALASSFDLFTFWTLGLLSSGFAIAARRPVSSAAVGVLVLWAIYVLIKVALSTIF
jgi:hypothetical protein